MSAGPASLTLDLSRHCIETEVRRQYNRALSAALRRPDDARRIEPVIELALRCLACLDFPALRRHHPPLAGGAAADVTITTNGGALCIEMNGRPVTPILRADAPDPKRKDRL